MTYFYAFLFCGFVCMLGQIILDNTKLTPGHITTLFVIIGAFLDIFGIYDKIVLMSSASENLTKNKRNHNDFLNLMAELDKLTNLNKDPQED